jgi:ABC-type phosphate transport system substrate-binding protein
MAIDGVTTSEPMSFTTPANKSKKQLIKTIFIAPTATPANNNLANNNSSVQSSNLPATEFEFYFTYNKKKINDSDPVWKAFIDKIVELSNLSIHHYSIHL